MFDFLKPKPTSIVSAADALPGRSTPMSLNPTHVVLGGSMMGPYPEDASQLWLGMGCFWGVEKALWKLDGVITTACGYAGGTTPHPTYEEVCTGRTGHTEVVLVVYRPSVLPHEKLMQVFLESHDPTQGMRQGNDVGTQYRSACYWKTPEQLDAYEAARGLYQPRLSAAGHGLITTEVCAQQSTTGFFFAEQYHQQYLHKNPDGYCGLEGTGVSCPVPLLTRS
jgi:peptide-methionine (S)-S-oxide reductase